MSTALIPIELSSAQQSAIAALAREHGLEQHSWEMTAEFVARILRDLDRHPNLARAITINIFHISPPTTEGAVPSGRVVVHGALWAVRIGLTAFGIYSLF